MDRAALVKEIKARIPISSIVSVAVKLKGRSPNFLGLCPFHQEKTPSFHVRDSVSRFKCFGCGASGDGFEFLMKLRGISFLEAVKELAIQAGLASPKSVAKPNGSGERDILFAQRAAQEFFVAQLQSSSVAKNYLLEQRGLSERMVRQAALGFGGGSKEQFIEFLQKKGVSEKRALEAGLLKQGRFSVLPTFLGRITFPIRDNEGQIVAFGGRAFMTSDEDTPKYVNTHSYEHYEKRKSLYGWFESKPAMQKGMVPVLVEGYFDAMALWALGMPAVALCGTALSNDHLLLLKTMSSRIVLCFDADSAGVSALPRALVMVNRLSIDARLMLLQEKDPGEYLVKRNLEGLRALSNDLVDAICYLIDQAALSASESVTERVHQIDLLLPIFASIKRPLLRRQYVAYLAKRLHEEPALVWAEIEHRVKSEPAAKTGEQSGRSIRARALTPHERLALEIALSDPALVAKMSSVRPSLSPAIGELLEHFAASWQEQQDSKTEVVMEASAKALSEALWVKIIPVVHNRIVVTENEAAISLAALEKKIALQVSGASITRKRLELEDHERKKDYAAVLSSLKEKSELLWWHKASKRADSGAKARPVSWDRALEPNAITKDSKVKDLGGNDSFFNTSEDW